MDSDFRDSREINSALLLQEAVYKPSASMQVSLWSQLDIPNPNLIPSKINSSLLSYHSLLSEGKQANTHQRWMWEVKWINMMKVYKIICASHYHSRSQQVNRTKNNWEPLYIKPSRILSAGSHCLISAEDLSCCGGDVWNTLMVKPGGWLFKAAWNKRLSLQAVQFRSPYLSSVEMRAHKEMIPDLQGNSYRCEECICKIIWLWAAG